MSALQIVVLVLAGAGVLLMVISAFGLVRLRGVHRRMHASSVAGSLGILLLLLSAGVYYYDSVQLGRMALLVIFFFVTAPIATTAMARAAYRTHYARVRTYLNRDDMAGEGYRPDYAGEREP